MGSFCSHLVVVCSVWQVVAFFSLLYFIWPMKELRCDDNEKTLSSEINDREKTIETKIFMKKKKKEREKKVYLKRVALCHKNRLNFMLNRQKNSIEKNKIPKTALDGKKRGQNKNSKDIKDWKRTHNICACGHEIKRVGRRYLAALKERWKEE